MKHAVMIMAHKNFEFLHHLIEYFTRDCYVFVHIDKKSGITREQEACLRAMPQVSGVYRKYSVHWGGFSILKCELFLLKQAIHSSDADYFHLISGQDYPIKPLSAFLEFFEKNKGKEFLQYTHLPNAHWDNNTYRRFQYFFPFDWLERNRRTYHIIKKCVKWQKRLGIKRRIPDYFEHLYGSSQWFSITRQSTTTILNYTHRHPSFYNRCRWTFASEEYYVATILVNLTDKNNIIPFNYRFIRWKPENGSYPANLDSKHFHLLIEDVSFFARKFEIPLSNTLIEKIDIYLHIDSPISTLSTGGWVYNGFLKYEYHHIITTFIQKLFISEKLQSVIDIGCGAGIYVAALRRMGVPASGYDANPYTPELSSLLLPKGDEPCDILDITEDFENEETFDIVLCLNVLTCIPVNLRGKAIDNICRLSGRYVIVGWKKNKPYKCDSMFYSLSETQIIRQFDEQNIEVNTFITNSMRSILREKNIDLNILVFQRKGIIQKLI